MLCANYYPSDVILAILFKQIDKFLVQSEYLLYNVFNLAIDSEAERG